MDWSSMTFEEFLFNARYGIIGGVIFLVFVGGFLREVISELMTARAEHRNRVRSVAFGPLVHDAMLGQTMTDGGEPVQESDSKTN